MRKLVAMAVICMMVMALFMPSFAAAATDYSYVRVKLSSMGSPASVQFKVAGAYRVAEDSAIDLFPGITYTIKVSGTSLVISYNNGVGTKTHTLPTKATLVQYTNGTSKNFLYVNNPAIGWRYYSGSMAFTRSGSYLQLVNTVYIETYLYGVVAYEMGNDWPAEALKAQAICARTYAMSRIKSNPGGTWHLVDTSADQVYKGYPLVNNSLSTPMQNVINAVDATRTKALINGDVSLMNLASGQYSASNGGQIRSTATNDDFDIRNASSPTLTYIFPKNASVAAMNADITNATDRAKANTMLTLLKEKLPAELAKQGITCTADDITINGITSAVPTDLREGMPQGSKEFTKVAVTVSISVDGAPSPAPVAVVKGNNTTISDGDITPSALDDTDFGSLNVDGGTAVKTYTIHNSGNSVLNISGITISGDNSADFTVGTPAPTIVAANSSATFTVTFDPSATGPRTATVNIVSNDAGSPYTFRVQGQGGGQSNQKEFTSFQFAGLSPVVNGAINTTDKTIALTVPAATDLTNLVATFAVSPGATVVVGEVPQTSGTTINDFTTSVAYKVTAEDGSHEIYIVTVTKVSAKGPTGTVYLSNSEDYKVTSGGGGMPATFSVTVTLSYVSKAADGDWDVFGDLRTRFTSYGTTLEASRYWLLHEGTAYGGKCLTVVARGFGHGRGMSQRGAQQMANENKPNTTTKHTYLDIVGFYFPGYTPTATGIGYKALTQIPGKGSSAQYGKVNASTLNVRAAASTRGILVGSLPKNTIIEIIGTSGSWYRILQGSTGLVGYVSAQYITKTTTAPTATPAPTASPSPSPSASTTASTTGSPTATPGPTATPAPIMGRVLATELNMRTLPNTTSTIKFVLKKGDNVFITNTNAAVNWYKVKYLSYEGYCMYQNGTTKYIEIIGATSSPGATPTPTASGTAGPGSTTLQPVKATADITSGFLTLRQSASTTATKVAEISKGAQFTVLKVHTTPAWLYVSYSDKTGYVLAKYAKIGGNTAYQACTVTVSQLNVRIGAGTGYDILGTLKSGDTVTVTATVSSSTGKWYKILFGTVTGYIDARYARISVK